MEAQEERETADGEILVRARQRVAYLECLNAQLSVQGEAFRQREERLGRSLFEAERREAALRERMEALEKVIADRDLRDAELHRRLESAQAGQVGAEGRLFASTDRLTATLRQTERTLEEERSTHALQADQHRDALAYAALLEGANERLFGKLRELHATMHTGSPEEDQLSDFIASMRAEMQSLEQLLQRAQSREAALAAALEHPQHPQAAVPAPPQVKPQEDPAPAPRAAPQPDWPVATAALVERWIQALSKPGADQARAARELVRLLGPWAAPHLVAAAEVAPPPERGAILRALGETRDPAAFESAARFLDDASVEVRLPALDAAVALAAGRKQDLLGLLVTAARDPDPRLRRRALIHAALLESTSAAPLARSLATDAEPEVRRMAVVALGAARDIGSAEALLQRLGDSDPSVQQAAAEAAARLFGPLIDPIASLPERERRAAIARLTGYLTAAADRLAPGGRLLPPEALAALLPPELAETSPAAPLPMPAYEAIAEALRTSLRGLSEEQLGRELGREAGSLRETLDALIAAGRLVRRGTKLHLP